MPIWKGAHPQNFRSERAGYQPEAVVIHIMDGSLTGTDSWFNDPRSQVSAHYGVGRTGAIHHYVKETDCAFHAGTVEMPRWKLIKRMGQGGRIINPNYYTIGVEHEGRGLSSEHWPQAMLEASLDLVADIARRWNIPADADHFIPHRDIRKSKPMCPGSGIDLAEYIAEVNRRQLPTEPPPTERSIALLLRVLRTANIRSRPGTDGPPVRKLIVGDMFSAVAVVAGETVAGNANWFRSASDEYLWAGTTDHPVSA
ncbi:MAG: peptidoglycan recognition family protein [Betaproteobacteria bacterium]